MQVLSNRVSEEQKQPTIFFIFYVYFPSLQLQKRALGS